MRSSKRLPPQVILLGFAALLNDASSEMIYPLLPVFLTTTLGATPVLIGVIEGVSDGLASILKLVSGTISDRIPRRKPLIVTGYALAAISRGWIASAGRWPAVLGARLLDRTGKGMRSAPRDALIADVTPPENRGRAFGLHRALDHSGAVIGPLLALALLQFVTTRQVFWIAMIPGAIGVALLMIALKEIPRGEADVSMQNGGRKSASPLPRAFWRAVAAIALFSLANSSDAFLLLLAYDAGVSTTMLPLLWASHHLIKVAFSTHTGALSDRVRRTNLLVAGWSSYAIIYALFPFARTLTSFFILFILYAIPFTLTEGAERAWISELVPQESRGRSFGVYYLASGLCVLAGSALFGWIYQEVSRSAAFFTGAGLAVTATCVLMVTARPQAPPRRLASSSPAQG